MIHECRVRYRDRICNTHHTGKPYKANAGDTCPSDVEPDSRATASASWWGNKLTAKLCELRWKTRRVSS